jgi:hypothetical protein
MIAEQPEVALWLDPGKTTGVAWYSRRTGHFYSSEREFAEVGSLVMSMGSGPGCGGFAVGWEMYLNTQGSKGSPSYAYEVIGMVKWLAEEYGFTTLPPVPSSARKLGSPEMLRKLGWWKSSYGHANDASAHLLAWSLRTKWLPDDLLGVLFDTPVKGVDAKTR